MAKNTDNLIANLVDELRPVRRLQQRSGMARAMLVLVAGTAIMTLGFGVRLDLAEGRPDPTFLISAGLFLVLALASGWGVVDMALPYVGTRREGWGWTALMAGVLPVSALVLTFAGWLRGQGLTIDRDGMRCMGFGIIIGLLTATTLVTWLRRGAPSRPERAALLTGVASGAAGIFAVSLYCPHSDLVHIGIWHGATVIVMGLAGRVLLPRLLAW
ncbi:MAG: NrsF family protein [Novosphingobium sp.]